MPIRGRPAAAPGLILRIGVIYGVFLDDTRNDQAIAGCRCLRLSPHTFSLAAAPGLIIQISFIHRSFVSFSRFEDIAKSSDDMQTNLLLQFQATR